MRTELGDIVMMRFDGIHVKCFIIFLFASRFFFSS
jgi:hypothetical protein